MSLADKRTLLASGTLPAGATSTAAVAAAPVESPAEPEPEPEQEAVAAVPGGASGDMIYNTRVLAPGSGVYYRVQVAALQNPIDARTLFSEAGLSEEVFVEQHEGLYKYTAGSFTDYNRAKGNHTSSSSFSFWGLCRHRPRKANTIPCFSGWIP